MVSKDKTAMGAFVVGGLLLFGLGLFLIGDRRMLFSKSAEYLHRICPDQRPRGRSEGPSWRNGRRRDCRNSRSAGTGIEIPSEIQNRRKAVSRYSHRFHCKHSDRWLTRKQVPADRYRNHRHGAAGILRFTAENHLKLATSWPRIRETVTAIDETVGEVKGDVTDATQTVAEAAKHVDQIIVAAQEPLEKFTAAAGGSPRTPAPSSRASGPARERSANS